MADDFNKLLGEMKTNNALTTQLLAEKKADDSPKQLLMGNIFEILNAQMLFAKEKELIQETFDPNSDIVKERQELISGEISDLNIDLGEDVLRIIAGLELLGLAIVKLAMIGVDQMKLDVEYNNSQLAKLDNVSKELGVLEKEVRQVPISFDKSDKKSKSKQKEIKKDDDKKQKGLFGQLADAITEPFTGLKESLDEMSEGIVGKGSFIAMLFIGVASLLTFFKPAADALAAVVNGTGQFFSGLGAVFRGEMDVATFLEQNLVAVLTAIGLQFTKFGLMIRKVLGFLFKIVQRFFLIPYLFFQTISGAVDGFMESLKSGAGPFEIFFSTIEGAILGLGEGIRSLLLGIVDLFVPERFQASVTEFINNVMDSILDVFQFAFDGLKTLGNFLDNVGSAIINFFTGGGDEAQGMYKGGPVASGTPYVVGEKGPELFVPGAAGSIVPGMGGGAPIIVNNNQVNQSSNTANHQHSNVSITDSQQEITGL